MNIKKSRWNNNGNSANNGNNSNNIPTFYVVIPASVRYDKRLRATEKLLYGELTVLCHQRGECWATNRYFAELYGVSTRTVIRWLNNLKLQGYIDVKLLRDENKQVKQRLIKLLNNDYKNKNNDKYVTTPPDNNVTTPHDKTVADNNTSRNNTSKNKKTVVAESVDSNDENINNDENNNNNTTNNNFNVDNNFFDKTDNNNDNDINNDINNNEAGNNNRSKRSLKPQEFNEWYNNNRNYDPIFNEFIKLNDLTNHDNIHEKEKFIYYYSSINKPLSIDGFKFWLLKAKDFNITKRAIDTNGERPEGKNAWIFREIKN